MAISKTWTCVLASSLLLPTAALSAQPSVSGFAVDGAVVVIPAYGEVRQVNDEAHLVFTVVEQDKDKRLAASRVNQKMREGSAILRKQDPHAQLKTRGYFSVPVYADDTQPSRSKELIGWRVGQSLDMRTDNLSDLEKTVSAAQQQLALSNIYFGLSPAAAKALAARQIQAAYQDLSLRIEATAAAMGRSLNDVSLESVDFEGSGAYAPPPVGMAAQGRAALEKRDVQVEEPSFEPGETVLQTRVVGKIRLK